MTYTNQYNWAVLVLIMLASALIRQFFETRHRGEALSYLPLVGIVLMFGARFWTMPKPVALQAQAANAPVLQQRCTACHSAHPALMGSAPAAVLLDTPDKISQNAQRIYQQAVTWKAMPLGNVTRMTDNERIKIAAWFEDGAPK
jgi:uncharacterized membrane protein